MTAELISRTGRVQQWLDNPESRLPVSCTVFVVEDSMEGPEGIEASWRFASHALRHGAGCAIHLSKLRPKGHENGKGLTASGPVSFAKIYSVLNETLRRGDIIRMEPLLPILILTTPIFLSSCSFLDLKLPGLNDASTLMLENGTKQMPELKMPSSMESNPETSGSTK